MEGKTNIEKLTEGIELAKKSEKKANRKFLWFLLIPIAFGLGWFSFSASSINNINNEKNIIEEDKNDLAKLLDERDSLLLVIKALNQRDSIFSKKDSTINAVINSNLDLDENNNNIRYGIIAGADNSLPSAEWEVGRLKKILEDDVVVFYRNGKYRTVVYPLTKEKANNILSEIKAKINSSAYLVNVNNWCPNQLNKENYFECLNK